MASLALVRWYEPIALHYSLSFGIDKSQGYQMAKNLQSKLSPNDSIRVFDLNKDSVSRLGDEAKAAAGGAVFEVARTAGEAAKDAVSCLEPVTYQVFPPHLNDEHVLSMI